MDLGFVNFCKIMMLNLLGSLISNGMMISERELMERLKEWDDIQIIQR